MNYICLNIVRYMTFESAPKYTKCIRFAQKVSIKHREKFTTFFLRAYIFFVNYEEEHDIQLFIAKFGHHQSSE